MNQTPAGSSVTAGCARAAPATPSSNANRPNKYSHLTKNISIGSIHSANYQILPPPDVYTSHLNKTIAQSEPKYLINWRVNVKSVKLEEGDTCSIAVLSGTLLGNDHATILYESYEAGRLDFLISKNIVKTNNGVFLLLGPITQGYPNNLYRACLEAGGIPRTWKYVLTQFSGKPPGVIQRATSTSANSMICTIGMGVQDLIRSYRDLRCLAVIADDRSKEHCKARKSISFVRHRFHQKLVHSLRIVNSQIIMGLAAILRND